MVDSLLFHLDQAKQTNILVRLGLKAPTADRRRQTADRRPQTADYRPPTADRLEPTADGRQPTAEVYPPLAGSEDPSSSLQQRTTDYGPRTGVLPYALMTLHRPANVDDRQSLERIIRGLLEVIAHFPILFPVHPRTAKQIKAFGMESSFQFHSSPDIKPEDYFEGGSLKRKIHCFDPLGYLDFLNLMSNAKVVLTDSGGIQEETTVLNIPCITLRDTTERPITLTEGTNVLVHNDPEKIVAEVRKVLGGQR